MVFTCFLTARSSDVAGITAGTLISPDSPKKCRFRSIENGSECDIKWCLCVSCDGPGVMDQGIFPAFTL